MKTIKLEVNEVEATFIWWVLMNSQWGDKNSVNEAKRIAEKVKKQKIEQMNI